MTALEVDTKDIVLESFHDFWIECVNPKYTFYVCKGGRNSAKSTTIAQEIIIDTIDLPISTVVYRKVGNTLEQSVFEQLKEATIQFGVEDLFLFQKSPLRIIYKPRGNQIIFRGADDPQKSKSIKIAKFPIAHAWFEEITEFRTEDEFDIIVDSILREELKGFRYKIFVSYNPPRQKAHWCNKKWETQFIPENTYIHHSTYLDNHYLSTQTIEKINYTKFTNPKKYDWMYLGKAIGGGVVPFENLVFETITDEEIKSFDNIRQGIDWGYSVDPFAFVRWHYDKTRRRLYAMDEIYEVKLSNREAAEKIKAKGYNTVMTIADSAEPKSIAELQSYGIRIKAAKKGEGSVEYGEKWLDDLEAIIIDPKRTPNVAKEFESIDYQIDREGNTIPKLEDKNNHTIDASRYSCEDDMKQSVLQILK